VCQVGKTWLDQFLNTSCVCACAVSCAVCRGDRDESDEGLPLKISTFRSHQLNLVRVTP
jgi:hypothetical protein